MLLKIQLYILSLWLLFLLLFVNKVNIPLCLFDCEEIELKQLVMDNLIPITCLVFICSGFLFYYKFKYIITGSKSLPEKIINLENHNWEHLTFLVTYIVPLLSFDLDFDLEKDRNGLMFVLIILIIGVIYVKTNIFYNNPTLALLGYHIYKVNTSKNKHIILISKDSLKLDDLIETKHISDNIFFAIKSDNQTEITTNRGLVS
ncbi:anti-phage protein KwaA [Ochrovirga pacifica]|uniref:anti-phage protein KwaA n=1 Tax=Ochrovirga pacifica TaxID=1042376 RepID=UPI0008FBC832|nr:anti-phage protein KwaA [Ochrovirga pacifica]